MFIMTTPERAGIDSAHIRAFMETLEKHDLATHSIIIARGGKILFEHYIAPFHKDFCHRIYSSTKSFTSIAVGFAEQDGLLNINDKLCKYFPKESEGVTNPDILDLTIRNLLMMRTAGRPSNWFDARVDDRVAHYFKNRVDTRRPDTAWEYDSNGSFILCALVERVTGKDFMEYMREKFLDRIGFSKEAKCLKCPGGHSWGDSAILCTARDFLAAARFIMNGGSWEGEQLLNEDYARAATANLTESAEGDITSIRTQGYGYQFWRSHGNGFAFRGLGSNIAICDFDTDLILVVNADTQNHPGEGHPDDIYASAFYRLIVANCGDPLPESGAYDELQTYAKTLRLAEAVGDPISRTEAEINSVEYTLDENPMGITRFKFTFDTKGGCFDYTNAQGHKQITFGRRGYGNAYCTFPQTGYSKDVGSVSEPGHTYKCAASHAWETINTLVLRVQIIDEYFGNFVAKFAFDGDSVNLTIKKVAEDFLEEYSGEAVGKKA
ncbi:MAG: beta-lactamase family protein [Clostridia bacterium]|nr:beta-lactamase family protein [Clostridia bacterium]